MKNMQHILDSIGIASLPEFLQTQFLVDVQAVLFRQSLQTVLEDIDEKRADTVIRLLEASSAEPDNKEKERAVWQYIHDAVPEFERQLALRGSKFFATLREDVEAREAEQ